MGHVHLRVADIPATRDFYTEALGLEEMAAYGRQAVFLGAGGYHHHLGANTWQSAGAPPAPEGTARLERFTVIAPGAATGRADRPVRQPIDDRAGELSARSPKHRHRGGRASIFVPVRTELAAPPRMRQLDRAMLVEKGRGRWRAADLPVSCTRPHSSVLAVQRSGAYLRSGAPAPSGTV